jgi:peroxiredoxin Q/BCP
LPVTLRRVIEEGNPAPDFDLEDQDGNTTKLSDLRGSPVVLYFYPKADTPGCTTQACGIRDHRADYEAAGVTVLGVSPDPVEAIRKFHDKQDLNFTLLADADHAVAEQYGTWGEKSMYGKTYMGVHRSTFIIDAEGRVVHVIPKASPKTHDDQVLKALRETVAA